MYVIITMTLDMFQIPRKMGVQDKYREFSDMKIKPRYILLHLKLQTSGLGTFFFTEKIASFT